MWVPLAAGLVIGLALNLTLVFVDSPTHLNYKPSGTCRSNLAFVWLSRPEDDEVSRADTGDLVRTGMLEPVNVISSAFYLASGVIVHYALVHLPVKTYRYASVVYGIAFPMLALASAHCHASSGMWACGLDYFFATSITSFGWVDAALPPHGVLDDRRRIAVFLVSGLLVNSYGTFVLAAEHFGAVDLGFFEGIPTPFLVTTLWFLATVTLITYFHPGATIYSTRHRQVSAGRVAAWTIGSTAGVASVGLWVRDLINGNRSPPRVIVDIAAILIGVALFSSTAKRMVASPPSGKATQPLLERKRSGKDHISKVIVTLGTLTVVLMLASGFIKVMDQGGAVVIENLFHIPKCGLEGFDHATWHFLTNGMLVCAAILGTCISNL